jgi:putative chitinase
MYLINISMKLHELFQDNVDEGVAKWAGIAGLGAAAMFGNPSQIGPENNYRAPAATATPASKPEPEIKKPPVVAVKPAALTTRAQKQDFITGAARDAKIQGKELAAFLAQIAHETGGFRSMVELGDDSYFTTLYDINGNNSKAKVLGNDTAGDGARYKGRGFIHLTGKDNYRIMGKRVNLDLVKHPELAEDPKHAAEIALWFWKNRVRPNVTNWDDVKSVTYKINPGEKDVKRREAYYNYYKKKLMIAKPKTKPRT